MNDCNLRVNNLRELKQKAEVCRHAHSRLVEQKKLSHKIQKFAIIVISGLLALLLGLENQEIVNGNWVTIVGLTLPVSIIILESIDNTIFKWSNVIKQHENAVQNWGLWIRKATETENKLLNEPQSITDRKFKKIQKMYRNCMQRSPQIPNKKFLQFKIEQTIKKKKSKEIDSMNLQELEQIQKSGYKIE